ncbi:hypothetical protein [Pedobacter nutrimenti]|jgi:hypothetical protein|uniref:Uncharacterized protein n=1 Tax=Pedobacter nutrimenti TaxID=1241337 RepID=A0A318UHZ1_9SPHI|nr:hypothetical protein [Pedobacter nutrimenti]PYF74967.1 hypothetical protein B0O44_103413 [Pedobacter nutrimenti]
MEPFNLRAGNAVYTVALKKQNPLSVTVSHYGDRYTMEKDFFGEWSTSSANKSLDSETVLKIGKFVDDRIQNS